MLVGLVVGFAGVMVIFSDYLAQLQNKTFLIGIIMAILSTVSWSFGTVYTSKQKPTIDILFNVGLQMLIAGIVLLVISGLSGRYINLMEVSTQSWLVIGYLVVFGSLVAYSAYVFMISKLPPTQVSIYAYINPIVAVLLGWLLLSEKMNGTMITGTLITLGGIYLVNREFKKIKQ